MDHSSATDRHPDPVIALAAAGAHVVLCDEDKRPCWQGQRYGWGRKRPTEDVIAEHDGMFGVVPWSLRSAVLDVDDGDPSQLRLFQPPYASLPTARGWHEWFDADAPLGNLKWSGYGCRGDVRGAAGYVVLHFDGPRILLEAIHDHHRTARPFPRDLFEAAGLPALQPDPRPDRRGTRLERELIRPLEEATVGHRNVSLFESLRRLADVTNRPHGLDGRITLKRWYSVVLDLALGLLDRMPRPRLPVGEVRVIAYHVGSWSGSGHPLRDHSPARQAARGRLGGRASRGGGRPRLPVTVGDCLKTSLSVRRSLEGVERSDLESM